MRAVGALAGLRFAAQVAAVVSLVEAPSNCCKIAAVAKEVMANNRTSLSIKKFLESPFAGKHPKPILKGAKAAAAEAAVTAAKAIAVADLEEARCLAAKFKALGSGALTMTLAQEAEPGDPLRECWLALERLRVSETRSISYKEILMACTDAAAEAAAVSAAEAAAAEAAAAEAAAAVEASAAAGTAAEAAANSPGAQATLAPELTKEPGGGAGGMAKDAEELFVGPSREALHRLLADHGGEKTAALALVEMPGRELISGHRRAELRAYGHAAGG
jgi:hypothetical protein